MYVYDTHGTMRIAADSDAGEALVASGRSILRTVLSGFGLKGHACETLARFERVILGEFGFCGSAARQSALLLRFRAVPAFEPKS
jgi:hypothetical protein